MRPFAIVLAGLIAALLAPAAAQVPPLKPARIFDGDVMHDGWAVSVKGDRIDAVGPSREIAVPSGSTVIDLPGATLTPGLIEGHSHVLLHPYNETSWNDQVAHEGLALRVARATNHLRATLQAGFTTIRDLGTEGAQYADVELKEAVERGVIRGPRMLVVTRAIVATGSYAPKGFALEWRVPQGAEEADGTDSLIRVVRDQIGRGADWIKLYGDYGWGPGSGARPTFSLDEMKLAVETARNARVPVAVHATTPEGMRRAILAGAETIEHGDDGTPEVFRLMVGHRRALRHSRWPIDGAVHGLEERAGTRAGRVVQARELQAALAAGATILSGSDVGVFTHGRNARRLS